MSTVQETLISLALVGGVAFDESTDITAVRDELVTMATGQVTDKGKSVPDIVESADPKQLEKWRTQILKRLADMKSSRSDDTVSNSSAGSVGVVQRASVVKSGREAEEERKLDLKAKTGYEEIQLQSLTLTASEEMDMTALKEDFFAQIGKLENSFTDEEKRKACEQSLAASRTFMMKAKERGRISGMQVRINVGGKDIVIKSLKGTNQKDMDVNVLSERKFNAMISNFWVTYVGEGGIVPPLDAYNINTKNPVLTNNSVEIACLINGVLSGLDKKVYEYKQDGTSLIDHSVLIALTFCHFYVPMISRSMAGKQEAAFRIAEENTNKRLKRLVVTLGYPPKGEMAKMIRVVDSVKPRMVVDHDQMVAMKDRIVSKLNGNWSMY